MREILALAAEIGLKPTTTAFPLERVNDALRAVKDDAIDGAAVSYHPSNAGGG